eukprot:82252-Chlamydomonas_euryale.AAC.4
MLDSSGLSSQAAVRYIRLRAYTHGALDVDRPGDGWGRVDLDRMLRCPACIGRAHQHSARRKSAADTGELQPQQPLPIRHRRNSWRCMTAATAGEA